MQWLFSSLFAGLALATLGLHFTKEKKTEGVIFLAGTPSPESLESARLFKEWLVRNGSPPVDLRIDAANADNAKVIIQGVSGVGGDLIQSNIGADLRYLHAMGLLQDLTEDAEAGGFSPTTYAATIRNETEIEGRQYGYPMFLYTLLYYVNVETFEKLGLPIPPERMSFADFEAIGKRFVDAANPPGQKFRRFFCSGIAPVVMRRSLGLDTFNETLTRCTLDDPRNAEVLNLLYRWTYHDRLLPSASDMASFGMDSGSAAEFGPRLYQFHEGNIGVIAGGNYLIPALRQLGRIKLAVVEPPSAHFPNALFGATMLGVYSGSTHKKEALQYLKFLSTSEYYEHLIRSAIGIPPSPEAARKPDFLNPPGYENEWGCNATFVRAIDDLAIPYTPCPFVLYALYSRADNEAFQRFMSHQLSAEEAGKRAAKIINSEIDRTLTEQPGLRVQYDKLLDRQAQIDSLRAQGKKVPRSWIANPFHLKYYASMGWLE